VIRQSEIARAINDGGAIVGTATYSGTNTAIAAGSHGVLLLPCQFSLLNGNQSGTDGLNFDGTRPTKISQTSPDNSTATTDIGNSSGGNGGIDLLGIDSFGQGRPEAPAGDAYVASLLVVAKVMPATVPGITYSWNRTYNDRKIWVHWTGGLTGIGTWQVTCLNSSTFFTSGSDNNPPGTDNTIVPSPDQLLYSYDNPGMNLGIWNNATLYDIAYEEKSFTYTLTINVGNGVSTTSTINVGQTIIAKMGGSITSPVWQPVSNVVSTTSIPNCSITTAKVQAALSAAGDWSTVYPITVASNLNYHRGSWLQ
jgi:hypothetical protein